ncbi:MAG: hypothetical protein WCQ20_13235 [Synechococcaceae cyanobacterium ELA739]
MKTALPLLLLTMTTTGCMLPLRVAQTLMPPPRPEPDNTPYRKAVLRGIVPDQRIDWIGNDTVVFAGWGAKNQPDTSIYAWDQLNPPQLVIEDASNFCVNGNSIRRSVREPNTRSAKSYRIRFPSRKIEYLGSRKPPQGFSFTSDYTCENEPVPPPLTRHSWKELSPGQGYLDFGSNDIQSNYKVTHLDATLQNRQDTGIRVDLPILGVITAWHPQPGYLLYDINLSPEERKRWQQTNRLTLWHLDEKHQGHAFNVPAGPWVNPKGGDTLFLKTRNGLVITTGGVNRDGSPGNAGAYLVQSDGRYERLETGYVSEPALSADGCRLAYAFQEHLDERSLPRNGGRILVVANLCRKQAQR